MGRFMWLRGVGRTGLLFAMVLFTLGYSTAVGNFTSYTQNGNQINITASNGAVRIYVVDENVMRVSWDATGTFASTDDVLGMNDLNSRTFPAVSPLTVTNGTTFDIVTSQLICRVEKTPLRIYWLNAAGTELTHDVAAMNDAGSTSGAPMLTFNSTAAEHYYGWGAGFEHFRNGTFPIDKKGCTYSIHRSMGHYMYSTGPGPGLGYGVWPVFAEQNSYGWGPISIARQGAGFSIGSGASTARYWMSPETPVAYASYYFCKGNWKTAMGGFTKVSGRSPRIGKKYYGIARDMYPGPGVSVAFSRFDAWENQVRSKRLNMDWFKMDNFFDWTNLCNSPITTACFNGNNTQIPAAIQHYHTAGMYFGGMNKGWGYGGCCGSGCTQYTCQTLQSCQNAINNGYDWAWYDAMNYISRTNVKAMWNTWVQAHNLVNSNVPGSDPATATNKQGEIKTMISLGWQAVCQTAWPAGHMGDELGAPYKYRVFTSALDEALIGHSVSHCDLAEGNRGDEWGYAGYYLRPMIAIHMAGNAGNTRLDYPASIDVIENYSQANCDIINEWGNKHYMFIPYFFTYGMIAHETGVPITRGMMCQNNGEQTSATYTIGAAAYVGEEIFWAPAYPDLHGITTQTGIYIPAGRWYDFWLDGGQPATFWSGPATISYALNGATGFRVPTFIKAGSIITLGDTLKYIGERPETCVTVQLFPAGGPPSGSFTLYEDEGSATWNTDYAWSEGYTTVPVKTQLSFSVIDDSVIVTLGAMPAASRYCSSCPGARHYKVEARGVGTATDGAWQRSGTSGAWTAMTTLTPAQYAAHNNGYYYSSANGGNLYAHPSLAGSSTFQVKFVVPGIPTANRPDIDIEKNVIERDASIRRLAGAVEVKVPWSGSHTVEILNMQGRLITRRAGNSAAMYTISLGSHATTMYVVRVAGSQKGQSFIKKIML